MVVSTALALHPVAGGVYLSGFESFMLCKVGSCTKKLKE